MATKEELQAELESRGLPTSGTKAELEDRLNEDASEGEGALGVASTPSDQPVKLGVRDGRFHYTFIVGEYEQPGTDQDIANRVECERQAVNFGWRATGPAAEAYRDETPGGGGDITYACPVVENTGEMTADLEYSPGDGPYNGQE